MGVKTLRVRASSVISAVDSGVSGAIGFIPCRVGLLEQRRKVVGASCLAIGLPVARFVLSDEEPGHAVGVEERAFRVGEHGGHVGLAAVNPGHELWLTGTPLALVVV